MMRLCTQVGNLVELINSRPKYRKGFPTRLLGNQVHVVLAMVSFVEDGTDGSGFDERSLKRIIEELFHEVNSPDSACCCCVFVFFPFILDVKFVGRTSRGHTGGRSHRISPPSFYGACLYFSREKDSAIPFPRRP